MPIGVYDSCELKALESVLDAALEEARGRRPGLDPEAEAGLRAAVAAALFAAADSGVRDAGALKAMALAEAAALGPVSVVR